MKIFFLRLFFILALMFFQFSFFDILFSQISAPLVLIASVVSFVLVSGFPSALFMTVPLTVFFDIVSSGMPGPLTLYAVPLVYATSFLSRRLLVAHISMGMILYALYAGVSSFGYDLFNFIFFQSGWPSLSEIFVLSVLILPVFTGVYQIIKRFEKYIGSISQRDFLKVNPVT